VKTVAGGTNRLRVLRSFVMLQGNNVKSASCSEAKPFCTYIIIGTGSVHMYCNRPKQGMNIRRSPATIQLMETL
jgi:hypothetical protein